MNIPIFLSETEIMIKNELKTIIITYYQLLSKTYSDLISLGIACDINQGVFVLAHNRASTLLSSDSSIEDKWSVAEWAGDWYDENILFDKDSINRINHLTGLVSAIFEKWHTQLDALEEGAQTEELESYNRFPDYFFDMYCNVLADLRESFFKVANNKLLLLVQELDGYISESNFHSLSKLLTASEMNEYKKNCPYP